MLKAIDQTNVQTTAQSLMAFLDREDVSVPGNMLEAIVSGKSLLRALVAGQLVIAQNVEEPKKEEKKPEVKKVEKKPDEAKKAA